MNYKMIIMYDGNRYEGWQRLGGDKIKGSIQGIIEHYLSGLLNEKIKIIGSGRTDRGVHSLGQTANFMTSSKPDCNFLKSELNKFLPDDIRIHAVNIVENNFHSRYHVSRKWYEYYIDNSETADVFTRSYAYHLPEPLALDKMREAAKLLIGLHDYRGFSTEMRDGRDTIRTIYNAEIKESQSLPFQYNGLKRHKFRSPSYVIIRLCADGFLYNMVRIMVGTLIDIGLSKKRVNEVVDILDTRDRQLAGHTVHPHGLFLKSVEYERDS